MIIDLYKNRLTHIPDETQGMIEMINITKSYMLKCYAVILMIFSAVRECPADVTRVFLDSDMIVPDISKDYSVTRSGISDVISQCKKFL